MLDAAWSDHQPLIAALESALPPGGYFIRGPSFTHKLLLTR